MRNNLKNNTAGGFTLVELAIVLMIIGLLIGGILRGQELMNNARMQNISKQITSYAAAVATFRDAYSANPGDIPPAQAQTRIPGCQAGNLNNCQGGDGNSIIGTPILVWQLGNQSITSENTQFWKHLALTHIISGIQPNANALIWGRSHPSVPIGGGLTVVTTIRDPGDPTGSAFDGAIVLRLHNDLTTGVIENNPTASPKQAGYIDRKMDDGVPNTGDVQSTASGSDGHPELQPECEVAYTSRETPLCTMAFLLNR